MKPHRDEKFEHDLKNSSASMCDYRKPKEDLSKQMSDDANTSLHLTSVQMKLVNHKHFDFQTKFPNKFQTLE